MNQTRFDRFEFEQQILSCWGLVDEIKDLPEDNQEYLNALVTIYQRKFEILFNHFELMLRDEIPKNR